MEKEKYKPGDLFQYSRTEIDEVIMILKYDGIANINSDAEFERKAHCYSCYNVTFGLFMDRTEKFLDLYYDKVA
jgi:hypothetical protein